MIEEVNEVINIYQDMQVAEPDNLSLPKFHKAMENLIDKVGQIEPLVMPKIAEMESVKYLRNLRDLINLNDNINIKSRLMHLQRILEDDLQKLIDSNFSA